MCSSVGNSVSSSSPGSPVSPGGRLHPTPRAGPGCSRDPSGPGRPGPLPWPFPPEGWGYRFHPTIGMGVQIHGYHVGFDSLWVGKKKAPSGAWPGPWGRRSLLVALAWEGRTARPAFRFIARPIAGAAPAARVMPAGSGPPGRRLGLLWASTSSSGFSSSPCGPDSCGSRWFPVEDLDELIPIDALVFSRAFTTRSMASRFSSSTALARSNCSSRMRRISASTLAATSSE